MSRRILVTTVGIIPLAVAVVLSHWALAEPAPASEAAELTAGRGIYNAHCAVCHGERGDGRGTAAYLLFPQPRDFTKAVFKFRSTPSGSLPINSDLARTIRAGVPGTSMPSWPWLSDLEMNGLVRVIKSFSSDWQEQEPEPPIAMGAAPECSQKLVARGSEMYGKARCGECHGPSGKGDGPAAPTLKDDTGRPIRPYDFTRGGRMKGGSTLGDVFRTFSTGLAGTPMPSYQGLYPDADLWALACHVVALGKGGAALPEPSRELVIVHRDLPDAGVPDFAAFEGAPAAVLLLRPMYARDDVAGSARVRAASNGRRVAILVEWADARAERAPVRHEDFRDAVALQFPVRPAATPAGVAFHGMGRAGEPVNIWHWKADWQEELAGRGDLRTLYPGMAVDDYPGAGEGDAFFTAAAAGNAMAWRAARNSPVEDLNAIGHGTLTPQPRGQQNVAGHGAYVAGQWSVVFARDLMTKEPGDAPIEGRGRMAIAVWDGGAGDRNGQKSISEWIEYRLESRSQP